MSVYPPMDSKVKRKWLKALRSGKYKQGHGQLAETVDDYGPDMQPKKLVAYCCMGVLCKVMKVDFDPDCSIPDDNAMVQACLNPDAAEQLWKMNDGHKKTERDSRGQRLREIVVFKRHTFKQIARWVEQNL